MSEYFLLMNHILQMNLMCGEDGFQSGRRKKLKHRRRKSETIIGALSLKTQRLYRKQADKGDSETFIAFLYQLRQSFPNVLIIPISDNSSIHKSKKAEKFLKRNPLIKIKLLTPYSPEYNPIGRLWLRLKKKVYGNRSYRSVKEVISEIRKIIWHYHKKGLIDSINFNFESYAEIL